MSAILRKFISSRPLIVVGNKFFRCHCVSAKELLVEEIKIPVPWGHIAGKWWGNKDILPVLAIHGWQDNANTFDTLLPLLNIQSALVIDLPGHGYSSHLPEGKTYDIGEYIISIHRIIKHFKWEKVPFLTHSFGALLGFVYSSMFPDAVKWVINIECARSLLTGFRENLSASLAKGIDKLLKIEEQKKENPPPAYKLSNMIEMCINGSLGSLTSAKAALVLLNRGAYLVKEPTFADIHEHFEARSKSDLKDYISQEMESIMLLPEKEREEIIKKALLHQEIWKKTLEELKNFQLKETDDLYYSFRRDPCIKAQVFQSLCKEFILEASNNIKCPFLSVRAENGFLFTSNKSFYEQTLEIIKRNAAYFEHHEVPGTHHCHLNNPKDLAPIINQFLKNVEVHKTKPLEPATTTRLKITDEK